MPRQRPEPAKGKKAATKTPPKSKRGGARPGAGRKPAPPRNPGDQIPWAAIDRYALAGALEAEITVAFGITEAMLQDRQIGARFKQAIARGHALYKLGLREKIKDRGERTRKGAGSVNALGLQARNHLDWDREVPQQLLPPDLAGARDRLRDTLTRLSAARSDIEGRPVNPLELVYREAFGTGVENPTVSKKDP